MTYYNVYSDGTALDFPSRDEADRNTRFVKLQPIQNIFVTRYGCYSETEYLRLETERKQIYELCVELKGGDPSVVTRLWMEYSRFWWEHRN